ncbi:MAG: hypothetical protein AB1450_08215 [Pseudomonadota bacterium]
MDQNNQQQRDLGALAIEARAVLDGVDALLAVAEGPIQIEPFQLQQLLAPARERLAQLEQELSTQPTPIRLAG